MLISSLPFDWLWSSVMDFVSFKECFYDEERNFSLGIRINI